MRNLWKSLIVLAVSYALGHYFGGTWVTGIVPAIMGFMVAYFILARGTFNKFTALSQDVMGAVQEGQSKQDPKLMMSGLEKAMKTFETGLDLAKDQFLIAELAHAQMGALAYQGASLQLQLKLQQDMQKNRAASQRCQKKADQYFGEAKYHLERAHAKDWTLTLVRQWQGVGMLAAMEYRADKKDRAIERLKKCKSVGGSDPLYWQVYSWMMHENGQASDAMLAANEGLSKNEGNTGLVYLADSIANQKSIDTFEFGMMWFSIFPEQLTMDTAMRMQSQAGNTEDMPKMNRQMRRALKKKGYKV
jgi:hypothetical protein